jgi:hypothetical protein
VRDEKGQREGEVSTGDSKGKGGESIVPEHVMKDIGVEVA